MDTRLVATVTTAADPVGTPGIAVYAVGSPFRPLAAQAMDLPEKPGPEYDLAVAEIGYSRTAASWVRSPVDEWQTFVVPLLR